MSRKKADKIRGAFLVLAVISLALTIGSIGAIEMGAVSLAWGVIKTIMSLSAFGFFVRCCVAVVWGV